MDSTWRGGLPTPFGHARGASVVGGGLPPGELSPPAPWAWPVLPDPAVPLLARLSEGIRASGFLSGGASGDSSAVWLGCWFGGRRAEGRSTTATRTIAPK